MQWVDGVWVEHRFNGGQAEYVNVPMADLTLQPIPEGISAEQSILLTDAMCTAYFGLTRTGLLPGEAVAVVGLGPIGLIGVELAFILGASEVFAIDPVANRRSHAAGLGATALDPAQALPMIMDKTKGAGVPRVFEASGAKAAVELAIKLPGEGVRRHLSAAYSPMCNCPCSRCCSRTSRFAREWPR